MMFLKMLRSRRAKKKEEEVPESLDRFSSAERNRRNKEINSMLITASSYMSKRELKQLKKRLESSTAL